MADAAAKVGDGKSSWQRFVGGVVDMVRPVAAGLAPAVMPLLDRPAMRRVEQAVNIEDLRVAAEKRAHAMVYGYLAGGADEERALRRSVAAYNDVELRHAVLHGIGHADMDLRTKILGVDTELPFFVTSCAGLGLGLGLGSGSGLGLGLRFGFRFGLELRPTELPFFVTPCAAANPNPNPNPNLNPNLKGLELTAQPLAQQAVPG